MQSPSKDLEPLLADLRAEGSLDSAGQFTLDYDEAQRRLADFGLENPHAYVLKLIQAAALCPTRALVTIQVDAAGVTVERGAVRLEPQALETLIGCVVTVDAERWLRELAYGALASLKVASRVEIETHLGEESFVLRVDAAGQHFDQLEASGRFQGWRVRVIRSKKLLTRSYPEDSLIRERTAFCPLAVCLNGKILPKATFLGTRERGAKVLDLGRILGRSAFRLSRRRYCAGTCLMTRYLIPDRDSGDLLTRFYSRVVRRVVRLRFIESEPIMPSTRNNVEILELGEDWRPNEARGWPFNTLGYFLAIVAIQIDLEPLARVTLVRDGITLETNRVDLGVPGLVAVVAASGLQMDLSELRVVENEAYVAMLAGIRNHGLHMARLIESTLGYQDELLQEYWRSRVSLR